MTVGGISGSSDYQLRLQQYRAAHNYSTTNTNSTTKKYAVSEQGNTCTDGKDDGKIGFFSAAGNIIEGAGKGLVNGVKGCFTDKNGKFSLLKTLGTVAVGAACIAFPAVGLAACAVGAATGGVKLVKGVSTAVNAKTDAEAKDAWEAVGDGALTVAASVAGAKASYNGVVKGASLSSKGSAIEALGENATKLDKVTALATDMKRSTQYSFGQLKTTAVNTKEALEIQQLRNKASKITGTPTEQEASLLRELQIREGNLGNQDAINIANKMQARVDGAKATKTALNDAKTDVNAAKTLLKEAKKSGIQSEIEAAETMLKEAQSTYKTTLNSTGAGNVLSRARQKLGSTNTAEYFKTITEGDSKNIIKNIRTNSSSVKFSNLLNSLSADGKAVVQFFKTHNSEGAYYEAVNKYGYSAVNEVLKTFAGYRMLDQAV